MTTTAGPPTAPPAPRAPARGGSPTATSPGGLPVRRRWGRFAVGAILALLGGWISASMYLTAGNRTDVVVVARDIDRYQEITADDLSTTRVAADPGVRTIPGRDIDEVVGRITATDVYAGGLLSGDQLLAEGEQPVGSNEVTITIEVGPDAPANLAGGTDVLLILSGRNEGSAISLDAWVVEVSERGDRDLRMADVAVPRSRAVEVGQAVADGDVILMVPGGS